MDDIPRPHIRLCIAYAHEYRLIDVERVWRSRAGHWLLTGVDVDKGEYRCFRWDRIQKKVRFVEEPSP